LLQVDKENIVGGNLVPAGESAAIAAKFLATWDGSSARRTQDLRVPVPPGRCAGKPGHAGDRESDAAPGA